MPDPLPFLFLPIACAGLGGFWAAASSGASLQRPVPHQRWDLDWCYSTDAVLGKSYARFAAFTEVRGRGTCFVLFGLRCACSSLVPLGCCSQPPHICLCGYGPSLPELHLPLHLHLLVADCRVWTYLTAPSSA
jgi:hypothetical protein